MNELQAFEKSQIEKLGKIIPNFKAGDTLIVGIKVKEGTRERIQNFEGICIARKNRSIGSTFRVRKLSSGIGVERVFPLYSPAISEIKVVKQGVVRRAKLYYLRNRTGKAARIKELMKFDQQK